MLGFIDTPTDMITTRTDKVFFYIGVFGTVLAFIMLCWEMYYFLGLSEESAKNAEIVEDEIHKVSHTIIFLIEFIVCFYLTGRWKTFIDYSISYKEIEEDED